MCPSSITFGHPLQQFEDGALLDQGLGSEKVHGGGELGGGQLLLLQAVKAGVQLLLGRRQHHLASRLPERLLLHHQVPLGRVRHLLRHPGQPQEGHHNPEEPAHHDRGLDHGRPPQDVQRLQLEYQ